MNHIKLDIDGALAPLRLRRRLGFLCSVFRREIESVRLERSRRGWHVRIALAGRRLPPSAIVAIQAILGSDYRREVFNLFRALQLPGAPAFWRSRHNVLYHRKLEEVQAR